MNENCGAYLDHGTELLNVTRHPSDIHDPSDLNNHRVVVRDINSDPMVDISHSAMQYRWTEYLSDSPHDWYVLYSV